MRQFSQRIRRADLEIEKLRLAIIAQYPVPVLLDLSPLTEEQKQMLWAFDTAEEELGGFKAAIESPAFTKAQIDEISRLYRGLKPVPGPPVPHPLIRKDGRRRPPSAHMAGQ